MPQAALERTRGAVHMAVMNWAKVAAPVLIAAALIIAFAVTARTQGVRDHPCEQRRFEGSRFIVCTFDTARHELRLASRDDGGAYLRDFDALSGTLGADAGRLRFAMNAGMFNDAGAPIGLYVESGEQRHPLRLTEGPGNFHMKPNGVFWQSTDGAVHVTPSEEFASSARDGRWATQSGPMLVIDGELHPRFQHDGPSRYIRNGVGVRDGRHAYFVISSGAVSFGRFARFFRDELDCTDALFFDGAVSSLWAPSLDRRDDAHAIGPMVVVLDRPS
jgi:uncharacterized protein YigE (DUF2233 family)